MSQSSSVYGPVSSWRVGRSLGVDLLALNSICSFRRVYCQLGRINVHTAERRVYVPTWKVLEDLRASAWRDADIITLSGSGEPTLAANLGEVVREIKRLTCKPVLVLTNSAHLRDARVRREVCEADRVFCKLDAADERTLARVNRPVAGVTLRSLVEGIRLLREEYAGRLGVQLMLLPPGKDRASEFARLLCTLRPDEVQLNAPRRPARVDNRRARRPRARRTRGRATEVALGRRSGEVRGRVAPSDGSQNRFRLPARA